MKRPFNVISTFIALSLFILGAFLLWNLSTQTAEVLETPDTGSVASNEIFLPVIEGGGSGDNPPMNDSQELLTLDEAESSPTPVPTMDSDGPCMQVEDGDFRFNLIGYKDNNNGTTQIIFMISNQSDNPVQTISFLNETWKIASPREGERTPGVYGEYEINLSKVDGLVSLGFAATTEAFKGNGTDLFDFTAHGLDLKSPIEIRAMTIGDGDQPTLSGQASVILHDQPCRSATPTPDITTGGNNDVPTPAPIAWDELPPCVNEPWDHTQWSNELITQRPDGPEQRRLQTLFKHQLQPMSPFLQEETVGSVADLFVIDERTAPAKSRLQRDVAALWFNVLYGKLSRATEVSFSNPNLADIKTVGDLLEAAEEALATDGSLNVIQSGLRQLLAGQDITRPVCGHMIHMRSGNKLEESIWDSEKVETKIDEQIQGTDNLRVGLAHMEPSPDYSMIAIEGWGYESGGPIFLYDRASAKLMNLIETLGIPDKTPSGHLILSDPWEILGWSSNSRNLLLGIEGSAAIWWVDIQEQTYRRISLGYSGNSISASKKYVDMLPDGSGFVYINRNFTDSDSEQGPQLLLYDFASDESTLLLALPKVRGTMMSYPRVSPDSLSVVYILQTHTEEPSFARHYAPYLLDIESQTQRILMEKHRGMLGSIPAWSPDGERIAFALQQIGTLQLPEDNAYTQQRNIVMIDIDNNELTQLTFIQGVATKPVWSFNGRTLSFVTHDRQVGLVSLDHPEHIWQIADNTNSHLLFMSFTLHLP